MSSAIHNNNGMIILKLEVEKALWAITKKKKIGSLCSESKPGIHGITNVPYLSNFEASYDPEAHLASSVTMNKQLFHNCYNFMSFTHGAELCLAADTANWNTEL